MTETAATFFARTLGVRPLMVILRGFDPDETVELCARASEAGALLAEIPVQDESAYASLAAAIRWGRSSGCLIGAGTVVDVASLTRVAGLGAAFTVAPGVDRAVIAASVTLGLPHLPGVATASEIQKAMASGCTWLKAFPASVLGVDWIQAMHGPFPSARFVATGGVDVDNATAFLKAGAAAVSLGSAFASADPRRIEALLGSRGRRPGTFTHPE